MQEKNSKNLAYPVFKIILKKKNSGIILVLFHRFREVGIIHGIFININVELEHLMKCKLLDVYSSTDAVYTFFLINFLYGLGLLKFTPPSLLS